MGGGGRKQGQAGGREEGQAGRREGGQAESRKGQKHGNDDIQEIPTFDIPRAAAAGNTRGDTNAGLKARQHGRIGVNADAGVRM